MATNKKHTDSSKYQKALSLNDRVLISELISTNKDESGNLTITLNEISDMVEKDPTTISKEVKKHRSEIKEPERNCLYTLKFCQTCEFNKDSKIKEKYKSTKGKCPQYKTYICKHLKKFPWVCNECKKRGFCNSAKSYYTPLNADIDYKALLVDSRTGVMMSHEEFERLDKIVSDGILKGQSVEHIIHSNDLAVSASPIYNYLNLGYFKAKPIYTHRMVRLRLKSDKRAYNSIILKKEKIGRNYKDFLSLREANPEMVYTEMDTVEGVKGGKVILSLKVVIVQLQFYFLLDDKTAQSIVNKLNEIQKLIGIENYKKIFGVILTDNGSEFTDITGIITDSKTGEIRTSLFFCHPHQSGEKGSCERNHEMLRYILPKGQSFDHYTQETFDTITSNVNSAKRKSTDYSCPIEKFRTCFGSVILVKLNIKLIDAKEVLLKPELLKK